MRIARIASALTAGAAVITATAGMAMPSAPVLVNTSPRQNRHWMTVSTNAIPLRWDWNAGAVRAELEITGMSGAFATNLTEETVTFQWRPFTTAVPAEEDVYDLTLTFFGDGDVVVGAMTSRLAVVKGAFGETAVDPEPSGAAWSKVKKNAVIPYDAAWDPASNTNAARALLTISKAGGATQANVFQEASGYYGWKISNSGWGYGLFSLTLAFPGSGVEWQALLERPADGAALSIR